MVSAGAAVGTSATSDAAVGQLIDFDADTPSSAPNTAMANLCMSVNPEDILLIISAVNCYPSKIKYLLFPYLISA